MTRFESYDDFEAHCDREAERSEAEAYHADNWLKEGNRVAGYRDPNSRKWAPRAKATKEELAAGLAQIDEQFKIPGRGASR